MLQRTGMLNARSAMPVERLPTVAELVTAFDVPAHRHAAVARSMNDLHRARARTDCIQAPGVVAGSTTRPVD